MDKNPERGKSVKKTLRIVLRVLGGVLAALACAALILYIIPLTETEDKTVVDGSADWMAALDDDLPLSEVVLPGTHDSATKYVQLAFFSKCQAKDIAAQLEAGFRYLDIRVGGDMEGRFTLLHGFASCKTGAAPWSGQLYLNEVVSACTAFLDAHPTETVVFAVKLEAGDAGRLFVNAFDSWLQSGPGAGYWLLADRIPAVGEARGRLVLLRRWDVADAAEQAGLPLLWAKQNANDDVSRNAAVEDNGSYTLYVQDRYKYGTEDKWNAFLAGMAAGETGADALSIHFLSTNGTAAYGHPYKYASALNPRLAALSEAELRGWIVVDFATAPLAAHIYGANFTK